MAQRDILNGKMMSVATAGQLNIMRGITEPRQAGQGQSHRQLIANLVS